MTGIRKAVFAVLAVLFLGPGAAIASPEAESLLGSVLPEAEAVAYMDRKRVEALVNLRASAVERGVTLQPELEDGIDRILREELLAAYQRSRVDVLTALVTRFSPEEMRAMDRMFHARPTLDALSMRSASLKLQEAQAEWEEIGERHRAIAADRVQSRISALVDVLGVPQ